MAAADSIGAPPSLAEIDAQLDRLRREQQQIEHRLRSNPSGPAARLDPVFDPSESGRAVERTAAAFSTANQSELELVASLSRLKVHHADHVCGLAHLHGSQSDPALSEGAAASSHLHPSGIMACHGASAPIASTTAVCGAYGTSAWYDEALRSVRSPVRSPGNYFATSRPNLALSLFPLDPSRSTATDVQGASSPAGAAGPRPDFSRPLLEPRESTEPDLATRCFDSELTAPGSEFTGAHTASSRIGVRPSVPPSASSAARSHARSAPASPSCQQPGCTYASDLAPAVADVPPPRPISDASLFGLQRATLGSRAVRGNVDGTGALRASRSGGRLPTSSTPGASTLRSAAAGPLTRARPRSAPMQRPPPPQRPTQWEHFGRAVAAANVVPNADTLREAWMLGRAGALSARSSDVSPDEPAPKQFVARPVPEAVFRPKWQQLQLHEASRADRIRAEALRRKQKARLPPRMEQHAELETLRRSNEMQRLKAEAEGPPAPVFVAREVPPQVLDPTKWQELQLREAKRQERIAIEAHRRQQQSRLPPRMEKAEAKERLRRKAELEKVKAEMRRDEVWRPRISSYPPHPPRTFEPKASNKPITRPEPFALKTDQRKGGVEKPSLEVQERLRKKMATDDTILPETRWPYVSTRTQIPSTPVPDFLALHTDGIEPRTTTTAELRRAATEEERLRAEIKRENELKKERQRQEATAASNKVLTAELGLPTAAQQAEHAKRELEQKRQEWRQQAQEQQERFERMQAEMQAKVAQRPYLFQQASMDVKIYQERQRAYDKFDEVLRKQGLEELLDAPAS